LFKFFRMYWVCPSLNRLVFGATLSRFSLELESEGLGFFDAAVQLFEQGRHLRWDLRSHRTWLSYRSPMFRAVQNRTCF
jgi:hypothetical protein